MIDLTPQFSLTSAREKIQVPAYFNDNMGQSAGNLKTSPNETSVGSGNNVFKITSSGIHLGHTDFASAPFKVSMAGSLTASDITLTGGTLKYGKTSFTDSTNAGYFTSSLGTYFGSVSDATKLKYTIADGTLDFVGTHSGGSVGGVSVTNVAYVSTTTADAVPSNLACSSTSISTGSDGTQSAYVILTWTALSTNTFDHYLIRYKKASFTYYTYIPSNVNTITIEGLTPNISYNFGIASVNKYGSVSAYSADIAQTTASDTTAPATVTSTSATAGIQYVIIEWTHNTDSDLASYNIYRNTVDNSGTATLIGNCRTNYFIDGGRTGGTTYYYWVKAVDTSGNVSASFSTVQSATPTNVESDDIVTLAGSKVLIDGAVYLSNWRHSSDLTKIDGGDIYAASVTTSQLNFTPVQDTNVIASINASAEGITIDADNLTISAATTFAAGYDPTSKITTFVQTGIPISITAGDLWIDSDDDNKLYRAAMAGADEIKAGEWVAVNNTLITTFAQDAIPTSLHIGDIWCDTDDNNKMYRAASVGADEITAGEWVAIPDGYKLNATGGSYDSAASGARVRIFPDANTGIQVIDDAAADVFKAIVGGTDVGDVIIGNYAGNQGLFYDKSLSTFSIKGSVTISGGSGIANLSDAGALATLDMIDINTNAITNGAGWTDDTVANTKTKTFYQTTVPTAITAGDIWFDTDNANKMYRSTNAGDDEIAAGEWVAVPFGATNLDTTVIDGGKIITGLLTADNIQAGTLAVNYLGAGTITSKAITLAVSEGTGDTKIQAGKTDFTNTETGFILGIDDSDSDLAKFYIGTSTSYFNFDGANSDATGFRYLELFTAGENISSGDVVCVKPSYSDLNASQDTYADENDPTTVFGGGAYEGLLGVGNEANKRKYLYIKFNDASIPSQSTILKAELILKKYSSNGTPFSITLNTANASWDESTLTWNNKPAETVIKIDDYNPTYSNETTFTIDITQLVRQWKSGNVTNNGLVITGGSSGQWVYFYSSEAESDNPVLRIYTSDTTDGYVYKADCDDYFLCRGIVGIATAAISSGFSGRIQTQGQVTNLDFGVGKAGSKFYLSNTAGAVSQYTTNLNRIISLGKVTSRYNALINIDSQDILVEEVSDNLAGNVFDSGDWNGKIYVPDEVRYVIIDMYVDDQHETRFPVKLMRDAAGFNNITVSEYNGSSVQTFNVVWGTDYFQLVSGELVAYYAFT